MALSLQTGECGKQDMHSHEPTLSSKSRRTDASKSALFQQAPPIDDTGVSGYRRFSLGIIAIRYTDAQLAKHGQLFRFMGPFAAYARRAYDVDAVGDQRNSLNAVQKFLEHLLQIKAWHTAAERQVPVVAVPRDIAKNEFVRAAVNPPADGFVNALISSGSICRRFHFHSRGLCRWSREGAVARNDGGHPMWRTQWNT
jgi:hypothetical protein